MNRVFADHIRLKVSGGCVFLSFKEVLYIAERLEAAYDPDRCTDAKLIRGLVEGGISRSRRHEAFNRLARAYRNWCWTERQHYTCAIEPFAVFAREREDREKVKKQNLFMDEMRRVFYEIYEIPWNALNSEEINRVLGRCISSNLKSPDAK